MCCNGTLFNYVTLMPDDLPRLAKYEQLVLKVRNGQDTFDEPCVLHTGKGCSAYDDRPATCSRYVCGVLRAVERDELTELEAVLVIKEARALVENLRALVTFEAGMPMAISTWEDTAPDELPEEAQIAWSRVLRHVRKHFLATGADQVTPPLNAAPAAAPVREERVPLRRPRREGPER